MEWNEFTVKELQGKLKKQGLSVGGNKADLINRLASWVGERPATASEILKQLHELKGGDLNARTLSKEIRPYTKA